ncbi:MAG: WG repeat-containing protein, partial [Cyclobacteriaceae bacterium]
NVTQVHTWQAYEQFFEDYPAALEVSDARARYEQLLFEEKTNGNTLAAFSQFLKDFPSTPYRKKAELGILEIMAADNSTAGLTKFIDAYPESAWNRRVVNRLYQLNKGSANTSLSTYFAPYQDSLTRSSQLDGIPLLTIYEDEAYGFINYTGQEIYPPKYQTVYEDYLCGEIRSDYLLVSNEGLPKIINRTGTTIYMGDYSTVEDLGAGYLLVSTDTELIVVHKSGEVVLTGGYDEITFPNNQFFVIYDNDKAGLTSIFGEVLIPPTYDDIYTEGPYWIVEQDRRFAVAAVDQLAQLADRKSFTPDFKYDDVELLRDQYLFVAMDDFEAILDTELNEIVPWRNHQISPMPSGWLLKQPFGYRILQDADEEENLQLYEDVRYNSAWIAIKQDEKWSVFPKTIGGNPSTNLDSVNLVGESAVFLGATSGNSLIFSNGKSINLESDQIVTIIKAKGQNESDAKEYFLIKNRNACVVYNDTGKRLFLERIDNVSYLAPGFFEIAWKGKKGIIKENGLVVQKAEHYAIGLVGDKVALILDGGKFGYYHLDSRKTISPRYSQRLEAYNANYLIAAQGSKMGIINARDGDEVTGFWYEDVSYWTDSTALVKQEDQYQVINIESGEEVMSGIRKVSPLLETPDEIVLSILGKDGFGIMSNKHGEILPPLYNDIVNLGTVDNPVYFAEQHLPRAEFYVVTYSDRYGKVIRSQAFRSAEYDMIYCEE